MDYLVTVPDQRFRVGEEDKPGFSPVPPHDIFDRLARGGSGQRRLSLRAFGKLALYD